MKYSGVRASTPQAPAIQKTIFASFIFTFSKFLCPWSVAILEFRDSVHFDQNRNQEN